MKWLSECSKCFCFFLYIYVHCEDYVGVKSQMVTSLGTCSILVEHNY